MSPAAWLLAAVLGAAVIWTVAHKIRHAARYVEELAPLLVTPAPDNRAGLDAEAQDACELLWSLPAYGHDLEAGYDRLRQAIRDEQRRED